LKISFITRVVIQEMRRRANEYDGQGLHAYKAYVKGLDMLLHVSKYDSTCGGPSDVPMRVSWTFIGGLTKELIAALRTPRSRSKTRLATLKDLEEFYALGEAKVRETV
jgi:hypothetical protein